MKVPSNSSRQPGFALVVTLSLMILLTIIAVALLTLSSISLRSSSQGQALATARANARLALMLALGDLQKSLGPDRAITATSEILSTSGSTVTKPNTTGVWESWWDFNPNSSPAPNYPSQKTSRFRRWLVSSAVPTDRESRSFVTAPWTGKTVELVGNGSLGPNAPATAKVVAGLVPVAKSGVVQGSYAWHVSDESVKVRVNLYRDPGQNTTLAQKRALLAGQRPDPTVLKGTDGKLLTCLPTDLVAAEFAKAAASVDKVIDLDQAELLDAAKGKIKQFRNDVTPYSLGVMADVRGGGLKQDLSSVFEMSTASSTLLPSEFNNQKLYQSTQGITGVSDPNWSALASYYNSFRSLATADTNPTFAVKSPPTSTTFTDAVPTAYNPVPVIAKVDTIFSLVARPCTDVFWLDGPPAKASNNNGALTNYDYFVDLIFTPVVTLHNPYNVNLSFNKMQVTFTNLPVAFNFTLIQGGPGKPSGGSQSVVPGTFESLNTMSQKSSRGDKTFVMNIANWADTQPLSANSPTSGPIVMKPGQTLICGPYFDPAKSFKSDAGAGNNTVAYDWYNGLTKSIKAKPSFTPGLGFEVTANTINHMRAGVGGGGSGWAFLFLRDQSVSPKNSLSTVTDQFYVEYKVQRPSWYPDDNTKNMTSAAPSFAVAAQLQANPGDALVDYAKLQFDYLDDSTIKNVFNDRVYRYPPTGSLTGLQMPAAPGGVPYGSQGTYVRPFAIFSAYTRTTNGGVYETGTRTKSAVDSPQVNLLRDGRLAGKPYLFHNPSQTNFTMNLATEKPGGQAYELNFQPFLSNGDFQDYMDVDAGNRVPCLSGNKTTSGIKSGSYLELPSGPLQTIADFRRSNALTTAYLPQFVQPVGNSLLHPLMSADKVIETSPAISATQLLDQSVLANHALYDRFYFSTFATRGTTAPDTVFEQFMNGSAPLASQAFQPYVPAGKTVATAKAELFASSKPKDSAYKTAAEFQMIRGPFNVNSTSVQAWKAALAAMNKGEIATLWARTAGLEMKTAGGVAISSMSLLNGGANRNAAVDPTKIDNVRTNDWNGYRELTEPELENLATKIVEEVRNRGPFLSMSEFVNRQVGPVGPLTLSGALEAAIAASEINEKKNAVFPSTYLAQTPITATDLSDVNIYNYKTKDATLGNPAAGSPGWVNQADLLRILEPSATVRGDTFVIRVYGEAQDADGNVTAHAYAEAVVQRVPDYVDPVDRASLNAYDITLPKALASTASATNKAFGRRITLTSFRWLSGNEI